MPDSDDIKSNLPSNFQVGGKIINTGEMVIDGKKMPNTTQQDSHGGDEEKYIYNRFYKTCPHFEAGKLTGCSICLEELRAYAEQLATRRAVELLRHLKAEADTPFQNVKQTIYVELDKAERELAAELKGHAK